MKDSNYEIGSTYARNGEYDKAVHHLRKSAKEGNFDAMNDLAVIYERKGIHNKSIKYYEMAASGGSIIAICNLGNAYENGFGVKQNPNMAMKYYMEAANKGYPLAYKKISKLYMFGMGVDKDETKAIEYLIKGAKIEKRKKYSDTDCTATLAFSYLEGYGVKQNKKKAFKLWKIAAKHGDIDGIHTIALCYLDGDGVKKNINKGISTLIELACKKHYGYSCSALIDVYSTDEYEMKDLKLAGHWMVEGANSNNWYCLLKLAEVCLNGEEEDYGISDDYSLRALTQFNELVKGKEQEYEMEISEYNKLKEKYKDHYVWQELEDRLNGCVGKAIEVC